MIILFWWQPQFKAGTPRLIHTKDTFIRNINRNKKWPWNCEFINKNILFVKESSGKQLHYHIDVETNLKFGIIQPSILRTFYVQEILALTLN
jgi:hypothetical protein